MISVLAYFQQIAKLQKIKATKNNLHLKAQEIAMFRYDYEQN